MDVKLLFVMATEQGGRQRWQISSLVKHIISHPLMKKLRYNFMNNKNEYLNITVKKRFLKILHMKGL